MSDNNICPYSQSELRRQFRDPNTVAPELPAILPSAESDEALSYDSQLKPYYYQKLGTIVTETVARIIAEPTPEQSYKLGFMVSNWDKFKNDLGNYADKTLKAVMHDPMNSDSMGELRELHATRHKLRPATHKSLEGSLYGGVSTAVHVTADLLKDMDKQIGRVRDIDNPAMAIRNSHAVVLELCLINPFQLGVLQKGLSSGVSSRLTTANDGFSLSYEPNLIDRSLNDQDRSFLSMMTGGRTNAETVNEVISKVPVVGCPILATPKTVVDWWQYSTDQAIDRGLVRSTV